MMIPIPISHIFCKISAVTVVITEAALIWEHLIIRNSLLAFLNVCVRASIICLLTVFSYFASDGLGFGAMGLAGGETGAPQ